MARPARNLSSHQYFHVINHAVDGQDLFAVDRDFERFEFRIAKHLTGRGILVHAYALMSNHFHLLVDLSSCEDPSDAFGELQSRYSKGFNRRIERRGPLFEKRFAAHGVRPGRPFHRVTRYIHANPSSITGRRAVASYRWSSLPVYLGRRARPEWLEIEPIASEIDADTHLASVLDVQPSDVIWYDGQPAIHSVTIDEVESAVERVLGMVEGRRLMVDRRRLIAFVALQARAGDVIELAVRLNCSASTVRRDAGTCRTQRHHDRVLDAQIIAVMTALSALAR